MTGEAPASGETCAVNLILFEPDEVNRPLPRSDPRAMHLLETLRRRPGEPFDAGLVNGPRGKGILEEATDEKLVLHFSWGAPPPPLDPLVLLLGLPRPQTARKILQDAASLGVARIIFFGAEKGERSYAASRLWATGEWRRHLMAGTAQAFDTRLPMVDFGSASLTEALETLAPTAHRLALDNYEAPRELSPALFAGATERTAEPVVLAFGPERGWSGSERDLLRRTGFQLVHLGNRVLRLETALVAAVTLVRSGSGWLH